MSRLTITLSDELHQAVKEAAARQGRSIAAIIEESLRMRGYKPRSDARALVAKAREAAAMSEDDAMALALSEVAEQRAK